MEANFYIRIFTPWPWNSKSVWNVERISSNKRLLSTVVAALVYIEGINGHVGNDVNKMS